MIRSFHSALLCLALLLLPLPAAADTESELRKIAQELLDAVTAGDRSVWDRHLAETALIATEDGRTLSKAQMLEEIRPLPPAIRETSRWPTSRCATMATWR